MEEIFDVKNTRGRGKRQALVKWKGYLNPSWHPLEDFEDTEALDRYEEKYGYSQHHGGAVQVVKRRKQREKA